LPAGRTSSSGLPFINAGGGLGFGGPTGEPQGRGDTTVVLNDAVSWLHGGTPWYRRRVAAPYNNTLR